MLHVSCYGARLTEEKKKERKKKMNDSGFQPFLVCYFKIVTTYCYYCYRLGQAPAAALCTYRREHSLPDDDIAV